MIDPTGDLGIDRFTAGFILFGLPLIVLALGAAAGVLWYLLTGRDE